MVRSQPKPGGLEHQRDRDRADWPTQEELLARDPCLRIRLRNTRRTQGDIQRYTHKDTHIPLKPPNFAAHRTYADSQRCNDRQAHTKVCSHLGAETHTHTHP